MSALSDIVDPLIHDYAENESEEVLDGIVALLSVNRRGRVLNVPSLVNRILKFKSKAYVFSRLVDVIGDTIERNFIQVCFWPFSAHKMRGSTKLELRKIR